MRVFISHSSQDSELAEAVAELLRDSLRLAPKDIRCTSVDGYRLPAGVSTDEHLKREVSDAEAFVGIISQASLRSAYVVFELGARWGSGKHLVPLLAPGLGAAVLAGPLQGINALRADSAAQLHQLVAEMGEALDLPVEPPASFQKKIDRIVAFRGDESAEPEIYETETSRPRFSAGLRTNSDEYAGTEDVIRRHCEQEWPDDYSMRDYCESQQREALAALQQGNPGDIPEDVFRKIRQRAAAEWPDDYGMRLYTEEQQIEAYRRISRK